MPYKKSTPHLFCLRAGRGARANSPALFGPAPHPVFGKFLTLEPDSFLVCKISEGSIPLEIARPEALRARIARARFLTGSIPKLLVILGPTASGKSELAVKIAKKFSGEIISADSRQVYKELNIGSGKITKKEMMGIPHYLIDVASPKKTFTVAKYQKLAHKMIQKIWQRNKLPIICGGTGFYIDALLYGYNLPAVPPNLQLRRKLEKKSALEIFLQLKKLDPRRAKNIDRYNKRRLVRALEIVLLTRKTIPLIRANKGYNDITLKIGIALPSDELKRRIKKRLLKRLKQGMIAEVKNLHKKGVSWKRLDEFGLEYRWVSRYLRGLISKTEMLKTLEKEIWHYAKRQMTWFRRDKEINWIKNEKEAKKIVNQFIKNGRYIP